MGVNIPGLNIFGGMPQLSDLDLYATTGRVFWVGSTACPGGVVGVDAAGAAGDRPQQPFATIDYAIGQCTASRGDIIIVLPGHAETVTAAITCDVIGIRIVGLGVGRNRPAITPSGAIDTVNVTAANVRLHNLRFVAPAADCTAQINIAAADFVGTKLVIEQGAAPLVGVTVPAAGDRFWLEDCYWLGTAAGPDVAIDLEASGAGNNFTIKNCIGNFQGSTGLDLAFIRNNVDTTIGGVIDGLVVSGADATVIDFNSSLSTHDGIIRNVAYAMSGAITSIEDAIDNGGYMCIDVRGSDVRTSRGANIPLTSAA